jgi:beta-lactamase regulating signal transducer with metallopeptidase domain/protocatechuate 3,4-dioxygenase beta subunit
MIEQINNMAEIWWRWMWPMFWQVGTLVVFIGAVDLLIRKHVWPQVRYALWMLVLIKLILPPTFSLSTGIVSQVRTQASQWAMQHRTVNTPADFPSIRPSTEMTPHAVNIGIESSPVREDMPDNKIVGPSEQAFSSDVVESGSYVKLQWQVYAMAVWLIGVVALALWVVVRLRKLRHIHDNNFCQTDLPQWFGPLLTQTAKKFHLRKLPEVVLSGHIASPAVFGTFRPVLVLPAATIHHLSHNRTEHILLHELAHIKRGDLIVNTFYTLLQIVYWFNPLLWLVRRRLHHLRELCCDATVARILRDKTTDYRETILETAQRFLAKPVEPGIGLLGLFETSNRLLVRLKWLEKKTWRYHGLRIATIFIVIALMLACILPMAKGADESETSRLSTAGGPLDIQLIAVRPDAGNKIYNLQGDELDWSPVVLDINYRPWGKEALQRDFIFELPDGDAEILFDTWQHFSPVGVDWNLKLGSARSLCRRNGRQLFLLSAQIPRKHPKKMVRLFSMNVPTRRIDLTLRYYYGPPRDPIWTFTGPFSSGQKVRAEQNPNYELTLKKLWPHSPAYRCSVSDNLKLSNRSTILVYDNTGKKHLVREVSGKFFFINNGLSMKETAAITIGEKPYERTFRNIVIDYPDRQIRHYPEYFDRIVDILGLADITKENLAKYRFEDPRQALSVIDVIQGGEHARSALECMISGKLKIDISALDKPTRAKVRLAANKWASSVDLRMRLRGVQLGLLGKWPEFFEQALMLLSDDYRYLSSNELSFVRSELGRIVWILTNRYRQQLTPQQFEELKEYRNGRRDLPILSFSSLGKAQRPRLQVEVKEAIVTPDHSNVGPVGRYALFFDGVDDYLHVAADPTLKLRPPFTVEMWIKPDLSEVERIKASGETCLGLSLLRKGKKLHDVKKVQAGGFMMYVGPSSLWKCHGSLYLANAEGYAYQVGATGGDRLKPTRPGWLHFATSCTRETYIPVPDQPLIVGEALMPPAILPFKGEIAEIRIWNKVIEDADLLVHGYRSLTGSEPNLVACWDFERAGGQIVYDISPNGNHARLGKSPKADDADPNWVVVAAAAHTNGIIPNEAPQVDTDSDPSGEVTNTVRGFVTDKLGRPRGNVYITTSLNKLRDAIRTNELGEFVLEVTRPEQKSWVAYSHASQAVGLFTIPQDYAGQLIRVILDFSVAEAEGRVVGSDGKGLANRKVELITNTKQGVAYYSECYRKTDEYGNYSSSIPCGSSLTVQAKLADANEGERKYITKATALSDNQIFVPMPTLVVGKGQPEETDDGKVLYSGRVLNEEGQPMPGVKVELNFRMSGWMSIWVKSVMTDENSRWKRRLPKDLSNLTIGLLHPEYIKQSWQRISLAELLNGTNVMVMKRGLRLRGIVKNQQGEPIENALVDTGGGEGTTVFGEVIENCTTPRTLTDGSFSIGGLAVGSKDIVVSAVGYAPRVVPLEIEDGMEPIEVSLKSGETYSGQVVDINGKPVEDVKISVGEWSVGNRRKALTRITKTDSQGYFSIENLPDEGKLQFHFGGKRDSGLMGFRKEIPEDLSGRDKIVMYKTPVFVGKVIDAETEGVIKNFTLTIGIDSAAFGDSANWSRYRKDEVTSEDGTFSKTWGGYLITYPFDGVCCLKVEAKGYLPEVAPPTRLGEKYEPCVVRLTKAEPRKGTVIDHKGNPAVKAEVGWAGPEKIAFIKNGTFDTTGFTYQVEPIVRTDSNGLFELPPSREQGLIVALHKTGYASVTSEDFTNDSQIRVIPWARIEVNIDSTDESGGEFVLGINQATLPEEAGPRPIRWLFDRTSFSDKHFIIDYVPSTPLQIGRIIQSRQSNPVYIDPQPGETYQVQFGDKGITIAERLLPSLLGKVLPNLNGIKIDFSPEQAKGKMILVCFWDMNQRPSRNCVSQLAKQAERLKQKGVTIVALQASKVDENALDEWIKEHSIPFPVGIVRIDEEETLHTWGVKSLPWLILTDRNHIIQAEGFGLSELDGQIKANQ